MAGPPPLPPKMPPPIPERKSDTQVLVRVIVIVICIIGFFSIGSAIMLPALARAREAGRTAQCQANLETLSVAFVLYADENGGAYPDALQRLYPQYVTDAKILLCPSEMGGRAGPMDDIQSWTSYEYLPGATKESGADICVCRDFNYNHVPNGRNFLYADGNILRNTEIDSSIDYLLPQDESWLGKKPARTMDQKP